MEKFSLAEMYRLEVHWGKVLYEQDGVCRLVGAYLSGPALSIADKINSNDKISVDFYKQYYLIVKNVYVATLSWGDVIYNDKGVVLLEDAALTHNNTLNKAPKLKDTDYFIIDTQNHEAATHVFNLVYTTYVVDGDGVLYVF